MKARHALLSFPEDLTIRTLTDLTAELHRQRTLWGDQTHRTPFSYLAKLTEEFLEAARALNDAEDAGSPFIRDSYLEDAAMELLQTAAVALSMAQSIRTQLVANNSKDTDSKDTE